MALPPDPVEVIIPPLKPQGTTRRRPWYGRLFRHLVGELTQSNYDYPDEAPDGR